MFFGLPSSAYCMGATINFTNKKDSQITRYIAKIATAQAMLFLLNLFVSVIYKMNE